MTRLEIDTCNACEKLSYWEVESLISELQMIADRKYDESEKDLLDNIT